MNAETKQMVQSWLQMHGGNKTQLARWMSQSLGFGMKQSRSLIEEAIA